MKKIIFSLVLLILVIHVNCSRQQNNSNIGLIQQLTGQMSKYGKTQVAAVKAMTDILNNEQKYENLLQIKLSVDDDKLQPSEGARIIQRMIDIDEVIAVIGAQGSSVTLSMAPIAEKNKVILISGASGSPKISEAGDYIFRTCPSDIYEGEYTAKIYSDMYKGKSIAILYINNDYGLGLKNAFLNKLTHKPSKILELPFVQGSNDFRSFINKIKAEKIEVVYLVGYEEMITIYKQAKQYGLKVNWMGNNQLNDQTMVDKIGTNADGTVFPGHQYELDSIKIKHSYFYKKYLELSKGEELDVFAAYAVDALLVIDYALKEGAKNGTEIKNILYKIKDFDGITGKFSFDSNGDAIRELTLYKIQNGKIIKI